MTLATTSVAACQGSPSGLELGNESLAGITHHVTDLVVAESFPVQIGVTVEIENELRTSNSIVFPDGCVVLMRAYADGPDPVWDMAGTMACTQALVQLGLTPKASESFESGLVSAATILGDSLPNGECRITAYLRPGQVVELNAGTVDLAVP